MVTYNDTDLLMKVIDKFNITRKALTDMYTHSSSTREQHHTDKAMYNSLVVWFFFLVDEEAFGSFCAVSNKSPTEHNIANILNDEQVIHKNILLVSSDLVTPLFFH